MWFVVGVFVGGAFGVAVMFLLRIAKNTDIDSGIEPSLGQEDKFVIFENAEELNENS